jgi:hypothetical protein
MPTFDEEIQAVVDRYPEVGDVEISFKTKKTFSQRKPTLGSYTPMGMTSEAMMAAEMIKNGEL